MDLPGACSPMCDLASSAPRGTVHLHEILACSAVLEWSVVAFLSLPPGVEQAVSQYHTPIY